MELQAGMDEFSQYGDINTLETLSGGNVLLWDDIMAQPYERIFVKLRYNRTEAEYRKRLEKIQQINSK
jgi:hypothetical protein